jgi:chaperonin GroES
MHVRPLHDRVLVKRVQAETKTAGGIIIPDNNKEKPAEGEIVSVGTGYRLQDGSVRALEVKAGDRIIFGKYAGTEIKVDGNDYLIMKEEDVLGVIAH